MCEEKESEELSKLVGSFWEGSGLGSSTGRNGNAFDEEEEDEEWEREVVESLESLADVTGQEG